MSDKRTWKMVAKTVQEDCGVFVDWNEGFFICPDCDEPIYEEDFGNDAVLKAGYCPICGAPLTSDCEKDNYYDEEDEEYNYDDDDEDDN